ncbi:lysoplasmalogenase [Streptomyces sp. NRRL S-481]|uniref:lysoplasmalogenase n=1 Tax=Streptomyces sp. NRRL S-481 TaxID=1463911 RepID=UPI00099CE72E|nr:lysoplasmalogenase [Streptomyces sp. NRRL S-481]
MSPSRLLLAAFALAAAVDLVSLAAGFDAGHLVTKPLLMPLLASWAVLRKAPRPLVAALLFGWGGDLLLLFEAEPAFLAGMASFAAGHVCYLVLFARYGSRHAVPARSPKRLEQEEPPHRTPLLNGQTRAAAAPALGYAAALVTTVALLWPDLPADLRLPVAAYSLLLTAMAYRAGVRLGLVAGLGGALFLLSDTLIATGVAEWPQPPRPDFWIMLTYIAAQALLAAGTLGALRGPCTVPVRGARPGTVHRKAPDHAP